MFRDSGMVCDIHKLVMCFLHIPIKHTLLGESKKLKNIIEHGRGKT